MAAPLHQLGLAAAVWVALHAGVSGSPLRWVLVRWLGERGFQALFSLLSVLSLGFFIYAFGASPCVPLWLLPRGALWLPLLIVPWAYFLLVGAFTVPNPTSVGQERLLRQAGLARGVLRITRHPFLWAVALWSAVHLLVNGNLAAALFFGALLLSAVIGTRDIDRKRALVDPRGFAQYRAETSNWPFLAILTRRNRLVLRELWIPLFAALLLTALTLIFHRALFRVSPYP